MKLPLLLLGLATLLAPASAAPAPAHDYSTPRFTDPDRRRKLEAIVPEIDREFADYAVKKNYPALVWGIVLDGELVHTGARGLANVEQKIAAGPDTRFRIASMTKSFTALAVLKLRDAGKLSLFDPVEKFIPEFRAVGALTTDAPPVTVRHLLTMTAGFPEDNPWGDRQLAVSPADLRAFLQRGLALSNPPGIGFEYSNLGYALLGAIISQVAGVPYQQYITREILTPLGMKDTVWEFSTVPAAKLALGYRSAGAGWQLEPLLHDGSYGAMGGLLTTVPDLAHYLRLHLSAWPARNDPDNGLVRRATLREMHKPAEVTRLFAEAKNLAGQPAPSVSGYGYGLSWTMDATGTVSVAHSGGLPGFGSNHRFYPEHGLAIMSFANLTYAGTSAINARVGALLIEKAGLPRRQLPPSAILVTRHRQIATLVQTWEPALADAIVAENFFPDRPREAWIAHAREVLAKAGTIQSIGEVSPENQLRGTFVLTGDKGRVAVTFTLTPEQTPRLQELQLNPVETRP
ncbi:serine hydrolase domain-containing protein [Horticoccus sp. 23ND18S-11]|uniref:serine hydrolase domain-containing protein n=1 Tax=Horticoccus sp. 23ND18S-11 TaxID=3391832 RepID=UPI0039C8E3AD